MNTRVAWVAGLAAGAIVWAASGELSWPARLFASLLLGPAPIAFVLQAGVTDTMPRPLPLIPVYVGSMVGLWLLAIAAFAAGALSGFRPEDMGLAWMRPGAFLGWTALLLAAALAIVAIFKLARVHESEIMREIVPRTTTEKLVFCGLALSAGVCEEIAFRGFLITALALATGSAIAAVVLSSLAFGVLHAHQNAGGALRAALLGAALAAPVMLTQSVLASMAAHTLIDVAGGLWLSRWLFR